MRALTWAVVGLCATASIAVADKPKLWIVDLDAADGAERAAHDFGRALRNEAALPASPYAVVADDDVDNPCRHGGECIAAVGRDRGADFVITGHVEQPTNTDVDGFAVQLRLVDTANVRVVRRWSAFVPKPDLYAAGGAAYRALIDERGQPVSAPPPAEASGRRGWKVATGGAIVATSLLATGFFV